MKKFIFISVVLITLGFVRTYSQVKPTYPIPSFNVKVDGIANFQENYKPHNPGQPKAKRELNVEVKCGSKNGTTTVWVYSLDHTTVLGPFVMNCGETLTVPVDDREWGVRVETDEEVIVSIWISANGKNLRPQKTNP